MKKYDLVKSTDVFVPSSGDLFLIISHAKRNGTGMTMLVFVPSSGDLFLIRTSMLSSAKTNGKGFRPLFWGFVFNAARDKADEELLQISFRPLFWGFVFNDWFDDVEDFLKALAVFVPSSGDLFLMRNGFFDEDVADAASFRPLFWGFVFNSSRQPNH